MHTLSKKKKKRKKKKEKKEKKKKTSDFIQVVQARIKPATLWMSWQKKKKKKKNSSPVCNRFYELISGFN